MTFTVDNPLAFIGSIIGIIIGLSSIFAFLGSTIWRSRKEDHQFRNDLSAILANMQKDITRHEEKLNEGERTMSRIEGAVLAHTAALSEITASVGEIKGWCAARNSLSGCK